MPPSQAVRSKKKIIILTALSLFVNVLLILYLFIYKPLPQLIPFQTLLNEPQSRLVPRQLDETVKQMWEMPHEELLALVSSSQHIGCGFTQGELALGILEVRDDVDIERFLPNPSVVSYTFAGHQLNIPCSLTTSEQQRLWLQISQEKAPFKLRGICVRLQQDPHNQALIDSFTRTDLWRGVKKGFQIAPDEESQFLAALVTAPYETVQQFGSGVQEMDRQPNLKAFALAGNAQAALFLAQFERDYIVQAFNDDELERLLPMLAFEEPSTSLVAVTLLKSPRKPQIWRLCQRILAETMRDERLALLSRQEALQLLSGAPLAAHTTKKIDKTIMEPVKASVKATEKKSSVTSTNATTVQTTPTASATPKVPATPKSSATPKAPATKKPVPQGPYRVYVVKKGDTLRSIAQLFTIPLKELEKANVKLIGQKLAAGTLVTVPSVEVAKTVTNSATKPVSQKTDTQQTGTPKISSQKINLQKSGSQRPGT